MTLGRSAANSIKIKTDGEAGLRAVSCACCNPGPCGGCPSLTAAMDGATSITIGGSVNGIVIPAQTVSIVEPYGEVQYEVSDEWSYSPGSAGSDGCGAGNGLTRYEHYGPAQSVSISFSISKEGEECKVALNASYSFFGPADYWASGSGGTTIPLANLIGSHSFTFSGEACQQFFIDTDSEGNPIVETRCNAFGISAQVSIS